MKRSSRAEGAMAAAPKKDKERLAKSGAGATTLVPPSSPGADSIESGAEDLAKVARLLEPKFDLVLQKLANLADTLADMGKRVDELEHRVSAIEDEEGRSERERAAHGKQLEALQAKVDDLENRSRRNNLRMVGIPESYKESELVQFLGDWLPKSLGLNALMGALDIERAHRLGPRRTEQQRPRVVIMRLLNFQHKVQILQAFRRQRDLHLDNSKILIFQDYSILVAQKRKEFTPLCDTLFKSHVRFTLAFPAILRVTHQGKNLAFDSISAAKRFVESLPVNSTTEAAQT